MADVAYNASAQKNSTCKGAEVVDDKLPENYLVQLFLAHTKLSQKLITVLVFSGI